MNGPKVARNLRLAAKQPSVFIGRRGYVLILSHMRSYSSLLAHLLGSHTEIDGYAEMNQPYTRPTDLMRLRAAVARSLDTGLDGRLVLDKVLHNHHHVAGTILNRSNVHPIFLVRKPAEMIASVLRMNDQLPELAIHPSERSVTDYYTTRLEALEHMARERRRHALVIRSEDLVSDPERTLGKVATYLGLRAPIETSYATFPLTGEPGRGDYSDAIREGRILPATTGAMFALDPKLVTRAERAYARCLATLDKECAWMPLPEDAMYFPAHETPVASDY